jgi:hypothetical protein
MEVHWHTTLVGANTTEMVRLVDIDTFGIPVFNPLSIAQDEAPEDSLMDEASIEVFPEPSGEDWEQCTFNPTFPKLDRLRDIVKSHGSVLFQPFDREGLRVEPLKLQVLQVATFKMQPCRFVREGILRPLKELIDQFEAEGVLVQDHNCAFASPLVVVHKKDGGIRMAVDYREVNQQLISTANQLPYQPTLFKALGGKKYFAKVDNLWGYHQLKLSDESSKITAIITPWGVYGPNGP